MITGESVLLTVDGHRTASSVAGSPVQLWTGHRFTLANVEKVGTGEVFEATWTGDNKTLTTPDHAFARGLDRRIASEHHFKQYVDILPPTSRIEVTDRDEKAYTLGVIYGAGDIQQDRATATLPVNSRIFSRIANPDSVRNLGDFGLVSYNDEFYYRGRSKELSPGLGIPETLWFLSGVVDAAGALTPKQTAYVDVPPDNAIKIKRAFEYVGIYTLMHDSPKHPTLKRVRVSPHGANTMRAWLHTDLEIPERGYIAQENIQVRYLDSGPSYEADIYKVTIDGIEQKYAMDGSIMSWAD